MRAPNPTIVVALLIAALSACSADYVAGRTPELPRTA